MTRVVARDHRGEADLAALRAFAGACIAARLPLDSAWHPGNIDWELMNTLGAPQPIRLWETSDGGFVAVAWLVGPGELWFEALPEHEGLLGEALATAEERVERGAWPGDGELRVSALDGDVRRAAALAASAYRRTAPEGVHLRRSLAEAVAAPVLPPGMRLRDCVEADPEVRAKCHRDAWNHLGHIGLPQARSRFSADTYRRLRGSPGYDPSLDLMVGTQDGLFVANCIVWTDGASSVGTFEPVGTHVDFRGRGLARAVVTEGLRRLRQRGMAWARVGTAHFNAPAITTYLSCGFELIDRTWWWSKPLPPTTS